MFKVCACKPFLVGFLGGYFFDPRKGPNALSCRCSVQWIEPFQSRIMNTDAASRPLRKNVFVRREVSHSDRPTAYDTAIKFTLVHCVPTDSRTEPSQNATPHFMFLSVFRFLFHQPKRSDCLLQAKTTYYCC